MILWWHAFCRNERHACLPGNRKSNYYKNYIQYLRSEKSRHGPNGVHQFLILLLDFFWAFIYFSCKLSHFHILHLHSYWAESRSSLSFFFAFPYFNWKHFFQWAFCRSNNQFLLNALVFFPFLSFVNFILLDHSYTLYRFCLCFCVRQCRFQVLVQSPWASQAVSHAMHWESEGSTLEKNQKI